MSKLQDIMTKMNHRTNITVLRNGWLIPSMEVRAPASPIQVSNIIEIQAFPQTADFTKPYIDFCNGVHWYYDNDTKLAVDLQRIYDLLFPLDDNNRGKF